MRINKEDLLLIGLVIFLFATGVLLFLKWFGTNNQIEEHLKSKEFFNIEILNKQSKKCENSEMYKTKFRANKSIKQEYKDRIGQRTQKFNGIICCNYFSSCKIESLDLEP